MRWRRLLSALAAGLAMIAVVGYALWPAPIHVEIATVTRGPFEATIDEDGKTRARERYVVAAPVAGTLLRVRLKAGDVVEPGAVLASIMPSPSPMLALLTVPARDDSAAILTRAGGLTIERAGAIKRGVAPVPAVTPTRPSASKMATVVPTMMSGTVRLSSGFTASIPIVRGAYRGHWARLG